MNNFEKYTFIKEKLNAPRFDNEDEEIDWFVKHLYGLYNQANRLREENNNYMARIDKYKIVLDKIKEIVDKAPCLWYVDEELERVDGTIDLTYEEYTGWKNILELLEKIE